MSTLKQGLQKEPAFPDGSPTGRAIIATCQIATQACHLRQRFVPNVMVADERHAAIVPFSLLGGAPSAHEPLM